MKKVLSLILAVILLMMVFGCKAKEPAEPEPTAAPVATPEPTPEPTKATSDDISETTGKEKAEDYKYNPVVVMIENSDAARPQTGLNQADIVFEALAESNITRFACLFNDQYPVEVGPVRSTRLYYISMVRDWDAALVHVGGPNDKKSVESYVYGENSSDIKVRVDGLKGTYASYVWRSSDRKAPHNCYTNVQKIFDEKVDYTPDERTGWLFETAADAADTLYADEADFAEVSLPFISKDGFVSYKYDAEANKLLRFMNGKEFMTYSVTENEDGTITKEKEQVCIQNLIVQYADCEVIDGDKKGRRVYGTVGKGDAEFFINGKHITGYWERTTEDDSTVYYTEDGEQIVLMPGNTWVELHPSSKTVTVS